MNYKRAQLQIAQIRLIVKEQDHCLLGEETSMKANSDKSKQSKKVTRRVLAGVLCGASVLSLMLSLVMPPISQAIANDVQTVSTEETVMGCSK